MDTTTDTATRGYRAQAVSVSTGWLTKQPYAIAIEARRARIANLEGDRFRDRRIRKKAATSFLVTNMNAATFE
jgi:hypothetical protein